jgi:uncharacterized Zn finger protein
MEGEFLNGELEELKLHRITCPSCGSEDAQLIQFQAGQVVRCEGCGLLELHRQASETRKPTVH